MRKIALFENIIFKKCISFFVALFFLCSINLYSQNAIQDKIWAIQEIEYSKPDTAYKQADEILAIKNLADSFKLKLILIKGDVQWQWGDFDSSLFYYEKALQLAKDLKRERGVCTALSNIGYVYMDKGNIGKAIEYYLKCIELNKGKYEENQQANYSYIATAYSRIKDTANAFYYFNEALQIAIKEKDLHEQASNLNNIGTAYFHVNDYLNAEKYYEQALKLYKTTGSKSDYAGTLMNVGAIQIKKKNFKKANVCLTEVLTITRENDFKVTEMLCLASFGELYAQTNRFDKADSCFKESIKMALSFSSKSYIRNILGVAAESYATSENYKKSYESLKEYIKYNDSLTIEENQKLMAQSSAKYSVSQKQASIDLLKKDGEIANAKMESDRKTKVLLLSILGLSVLAMFVIYNRYRLTQKQKKIIEKQKHEVEQQKDIIEHQKELVDEKQKEILDSITYAKRLQRAILPPTHLIDKHIPSNFVLYQPKDIVAADFYWMHEANG